MNGGPEKLLREMVAVLDAYERGMPLMSAQGQALDGFSALANFVAIAERARDLLGGKR